MHGVTMKNTRGCSSDSYGYVLCFVLTGDLRKFRLRYLVSCTNSLVNISLLQSLTMCVLSNNLFPFVCLFLAQRPLSGPWPLIHEVSRSHSTTHQSRQDSSGRVISPSQRPLPDNTLNTRNRETSMPPVWFEPTMPVGERPQTYALDRAATGTGSLRF